MAVECSSSEEYAIQEAADVLRKAVLNLLKETPDLPSSLKLEDFENGQVKPPDLLVNFFERLYAPDPMKISDGMKRRANSSAQDAVYTISRGKLKPAKHLTMGLAMKSLTGSRKVVEILNRLGHSISYHTTEEIETELATTISVQNQSLPDGLLKQSGLCTSLAWDNYDELTETLSGKDTLHDTVGICYQNIVDNEAPVTYNQSRDPSTEENPSKKRRKFEPIEQAIPSYTTKPHMRSFEYEAYDPEPTSKLTKAQELDFLWLVCCMYHKHTPMWRGWNALLHQDTLPQQRLAYMENIALPPTRLDVVQETMRLSQKVAHYDLAVIMTVHYDLAISKPALQIQATEAPIFDNIFICFGPFHIALAYFGSLGYLIEASGGPELLCATGVLATGSAAGFLAGRHFNRCRRLHPMLATAMGLLHFKRFLEMSGPVTQEFQELLEQLRDNPCPEILIKVQSSDVFAEVKSRYDHFCEATRNGDLGGTAKFWMWYVDIVHDFLTFDRACRTNDLDLFICGLSRICHLFFTTHRPNYARWMVRYCLNLQNMDTTHAGIRATFENGALSIRRTAKSFSRCAVDLTLEQTVNRDAASRQTGITAFTQSVGARKRWNITRPMRAAVVNSLKGMAGLTTREEVSQELKPNRIKRDRGDLEKLMSGIEDTMNPFNQASPDSKLYCLTTGRPASTEVADDLLAASAIGQKWHDDYIQECQEDPARFEKPIKRRKVKNFAHDALKMKVKTKELKNVEVRCTRDLFGRMLYLAASQGMDLAKVLSYPLTIVPLSLSHVNGSMNKTDKSALMKKLEKNAKKEKPDDVDAYFIDAMFFLRTVPNLPGTYGGVAQAILQHACKLAEEVHIVCDTYTGRPSIKALERSARGDSHSNYSITGPNQQWPVDFNTLVLSSSFKTTLMEFLVDEWASDKYVNILRGHTLYFATGEVCHRYHVANDAVVQTRIDGLSCVHEEADTRLIFHVNYKAAQNDYSQQCVVRCNDTDIFILLLYHAHFIPASLWIDLGLSSNNTRRIINMSDLAEQLGMPVCNALVSFHAFTGCDFTAAFMRKGKVRPYQLMVKHQKFIEAFGQLGESVVLHADILKSLEEFVCAMYGSSNIDEVNIARFHIFSKLYAPKDPHQPLDKIKSSDPCCVPPCRPVLLEKVKRSNYVANLWKHAAMPRPTDIEPAGHGWKLVQNNTLEIVWFEGSQNPMDIRFSSSDVEDDDNSADEDLVYNSSSDEEVDFLEF